MTFPPSSGNWPIWWCKFSTSHAGVVQRGQPVLVLPVHLSSRIVEVSLGVKYGKEAFERLWSLETTFGWKFIKFCHGFCMNYISYVVRLQSQNGNILSFHNWSLLSCDVDLMTGSTASFLFWVCPFSSSPSDFKVVNLVCFENDSDYISLISRTLLMLESDM